MAGQFTMRPIEMLESPAYRVLSLSAHRVLARLEIELAQHGGRDNGKLPVTYNNLVEYGVDRHAVAPAIRELDVLGFAKITEHGQGGNAEFRRPNRFRLTYRHTTHAPATDEWRRIETREAALAAQRSARASIKLPPRQKQKPVREKTRTGAQNPHRKSADAGVGNPHYSASAFSPTTLDISGDGQQLLAEAANIGG
jgi:hypothetical protein